MYSPAFISSVLIHRASFAQPHFFRQEPEEDRSRKVLVFIRKPNSPLTVFFRPLLSSFTLPLQIHTRHCWITFPSLCLKNIAREDLLERDTKKKKCYYASPPLQTRTIRIFSLVERRKGILTCGSFQLADLLLCLSQETLWENAGICFYISSWGKFSIISKRTRQLTTHCQQSTYRFCSQRHHSCSYNDNFPHRFLSYIR